MDALALRSRLAGVALAVLLVGLCVAVRLALDRWIGELLPFSLFTLAVVGSALLGGFLAGVVATLLSAFAAVATLFGPTFPFGLDQPRVRIGLVLFCAVNLIVSAVCERSRRARIEAQEGMQREARTRRLLEEADRERRRSAELQALATRALRGYVYDWDCERGTVTRTAGFTQMLGWRPEEVPESADWWRARLHPDDAASVSTRLEQALSSGVESQSNEYRVLDRNGVERWLWDHMILVRDVGGRLVRVVGNVLDITERKRAEQALAASEEQLRLAMAIASLGMFEIDLRTRRYTVSPELAAIMGRRPEELASDQRWNSPVHPEDRARLERSLAERLARHEVEVRNEHRLLRPDGEVRWVETRGRIEYAPSGEALRLVGLVIDVTERRRAETALQALTREREQLLEAERAARSEAEQANREKDQFLATLSHELRTPLSVIVSWGRVLQRRHAQGGDEQLLKALALIVDNAMAQAQIISDLLDMSRIVAGKVALDVRPLDAVEIVTQAVEAQRPAAEARRIALEVEASATPVIVLADPTRLRQVMWNLLSNALKFTPEGGRVRVRTGRSGERFEISVRDTGEGIAPEFLPHLFDRYRQADGSTSRRHGGLGLGLAIVRQLVSMHGGEISAASEGTGRGATFTVQLPLHRGATRAALELGEAWHAEPEVLQPDSLRGFRVLAVEDQPDMLEYLRRVLEEQGAEVVAASSGEEAVRAVRQPGAGFDVLISDIGMPGLDGYQLIRTVRRDLGLGPDRLGAVAVTAFAREEDRVRCLEEGFQAHLSKPYQMAQLVAIVRQLAASGERTATRH